MVASMTGNALWRVRARDGRMLYAEPIQLGERIRDIAAAGTGDIVLLTDTLKLIRLTPDPDLETGSILFASRCGGCHDDTENRIGPRLASIIGKPVATEPGYEYTQAMEAAGGRWTYDRLDAFLADPESFAPGTRMTVDGVVDGEVRSQLVEYMSVQFP
jgi:cytochrome c2